MAKRPKVTTDATPLTSNPFAALVPDGESLPDAPPPRPETPSEPAAVDLSARLIVRRQKKGHGGKTVTCIEGLSASAIESLLPRLKRELGCSARPDGPVLVAGTGDHQRVAKWLRSAGATRVTLGN